MNLNLDDYGIQIKGSTFRLVNDEDKEGRPLMQLNCNTCMSMSYLTIIVKGYGKVSGEIGFLLSNSIKSIKDLISIKNQTSIYCPLCGTKHDIINVEISSKNNNAMYDRGINQITKPEDEYDF
jgi:hypothetical protein